MNEQQPRDSGRALALTGATVVAFAILNQQAWSAASSALPPPLLLLFPFISLVALLLGFTTANVAFGAVLLATIAYFVRHPATLPRELNVRTNFLLCVATTQIFLGGFQLTFRRLGKLLEEQAAAIAARLEQRARLTKALVTDFKNALDAMAPLLASGATPDPARLQQAQDGLVGILNEAKRALTIEHVPRQSVPELPDFRARMMRWILWINSSEMLLLLLRVYVTGRGSYVPSLLLLSLSVALIVAFRRYPARRPLLAGIFAAGCVITIVSAMQPWGFQVPPPGTVFVATIAYHAVLIGVRHAALMVTLVNLSVLGYVAARGAASTSQGAQFLAIMVVCALTMQVCWSRLQALVSRVLDRLHQRSHELLRLEGFRARMCGTLFHDVANPVQAMGVLLAFQEPLTSDELRSFVHLRERLSQLIAGTVRVLEDDGPIPPERLEPVLVASLFSDLDELFQFRLRPKSVSLVCGVTEQLRVRALPELLRDSALANLVSNAIKFSPAGAAIELSAHRQDSHVAISVRDHGPGWPRDLRERLDAGNKVFSTPGSQGETGLGLGLTLAREYVTRMGGHLLLRDPDGGGSEAVILLPVA